MEGRPGHSRLGWISSPFYCNHFGDEGRRSRPTLPYSGMGPLTRPRRAKHVFPAISCYLEPPKARLAATYIAETKELTINPLAWRGTLKTPRIRPVFAFCKPVIGPTKAEKTTFLVVFVLRPKHLVRNAG